MNRRLLLVYLLLFFAWTGQARVIYVNINATGLNNGSSWANAYTSFDSIVRFDRDTAIVDTVWMANGVYPYTPPKVRNIMLNNGLKIYGGFNGTETNLSQRNWSTFQTVLKGNTSGSNQLIRLLPVFYTGSTPIKYPGTRYVPMRPRFRLDGIKFIDGNHFGNSPPYILKGLGDGGGAISFEAGNNDTLDIVNCYFYGNKAAYGGAIYLTRRNKGVGQTTVNISNCRFENNYGGSHGGAIATEQLDSVLSGGGGGVNKTNSTKLFITDCQFLNNTARYGAAIALLDSFPVQITRCVFRGNAATIAGGAFFDSSWSRTKVYNSLIVGNKATTASVYYCRRPSPGALNLPHTLIHCTVADNQGNATLDSDYALVFNGGDTIKNCIFWKNLSKYNYTIDTPVSASTISNNLMEGQAGLPNTSNTFSFDPLFAAPGTGTIIPFPATGVYDYQLKAHSSAIDTGQLGIIAGPGLNTTDLAQSNRLFGSRPDLGAYERSYCQVRTPAIAASKPLTFCQPDSVQLSASATGGGAFYWSGATTPNNPIWAKDSGLYHVVRDSAGCRSKNSILVRAVPVPNPTITKTNNTLSVPSWYGSYQWYKGGVLIPGATGASYNPTSNGVYTVKVVTSVGICSGTSMPFNLTNLSVSQSGLEGIRVYPNPVRELLRIELALGEDAQAAIYDCQGRLMGQQAIRAGNNGIDVSRLAAGTYLLKFLRGDGPSGQLMFVKE